MTLHDFIFSKINFKYPSSYLISNSEFTKGLEIYVSFKTDLNSELKNAILIFKNGVHVKMD